MTNNKTITTGELQQLRHGKADFLLLDVLTKAQFDKDHIDGAQNVPFESPDFVAAVGRAAGAKSRKIVVYCSGTACGTSSKAAASLTAAGHGDVRTYEGGLEAWHAAKQSPAAKAETSGAASAASRVPGPAGDKPMTVNTGGSSTGAQRTPDREGKGRKGGGK